MKRIIPVLAAVGALAIAGGAQAARHASLDLVIQPGAGYVHPALHVVAGERVTLTIWNYTAKPHTFTSAGLGVDARIPAEISSVHPSQTVVTFVAKRAGTFAWHCRFTPHHGAAMDGTVAVSA